MDTEPAFGIKREVCELIELQIQRSGNPFLDCRDRLVLA